MKLTADTIYGLTASLLMGRYDNPQPIPPFHKELWELVCSDNDKVAIAAPRGHAKSTAITHAYTLASVLFRQSRYVVIVSDTEGQATQFLGDIKRELIENDDLINTFGIKRKFVKDTETLVIGEFVDGTQFRIEAKGSEQKMRGFKWRNIRPDLIICDDLENDEIVMSDERREKFRNWFYKALLPIGGDFCKVRVVGTILHMDSLLERLMPKWGSPHTITDGLRFTRDGEAKKSSSWLSIRYQAHNDDFSLMLWPEKFSKERYMAIRQDYIDQGMPEGYSQEYLNYPIDESQAYFRKEDFLEIEDFTDNLEYYVGCDFAISQEDRAAYTAMVVAGLSPDGILKVVDVRRFRGDSLEIVDELFALQTRYKPELFIIEKENIARSIGPFLDQEMIRRGIYLNLDDPVPSKDKIKRARSMQARMRAGQVEFDKEASWFNDFFMELTTFPRGTYKDQVDAFAHIGLALSKMVDVPTYQELEDEEWDREEDMYLMDFGVNRITGY